MPLNRGNFFAIRQIAMKIQFIKCITEYGPFIKELFFQYKTHELQAYSWPPEVLLPLLEMQFKAQRDAYQKQFPHSEEFILTENNSPVGWLLINKAETYHIVNILVHDDYRGKNIGTQTIQEVIRQANDENKRVTLNVGKNNPAHKLYSRLGFKKVSDDELFISMST